MTLKRRERSDFTPTVRPRSMRDTGLRRLTPSYLTDISDTVFKNGVMPTSTNRGALVGGTSDFPTPNHKIRLITVTVVQINADGDHLLEIYYGTATTIPTGGQSRSLGLPIALLKSPDAGRVTTRTWARGHGPLSLPNEGLSCRYRVAPASAMNFIVEYTMET